MNYLFASSFACVFGGGDVRGLYHRHHGGHQILGRDYKRSGTVQLKKNVFLVLH